MVAVVVVVNVVEMKVDGTDSSGRSYSGYNCGSVISARFIIIIVYFHNKAMLKQWHEFQEQARLRDHRTVG